jgi:hypothetical protein
MSESFTADTDHYDLCVVGAGYAGLNALFVASRYLSATARILVLDMHQRPGGMWNDAYSYVRLHQPYRMFTAGNIPWTLRRERSYLATRDEVKTHLCHCFDVVSERVNMDARWGWECLDNTEDGTSVVVTARDPQGEVHRFIATRFIDATGFNVEINDPLPVTSRDVRSVSPEELVDAGLLSKDRTEPVWVIGSGKTAMDTVIALVRSNPGRTIGMVTGTGTYFYNRDLVNPTGLKRWTGGVRYNAIFAGAAKRFDGTNEAEVTAWCRARYGTSPLGDPAPTHLLFALLSEGETATVATGVNEVVRDHLVDVVDEESGPVMVLRTGARHQIPSGSWVVNCTGYLKPRDAEHVPYVSSSGRMMSINPTSIIFPSPGVCAFLQTHLFYLDRLAHPPFYELDLAGAARSTPEAALAVASTLLAYNLSYVFELVPFKAFREFGLDIDSWYPLPRQLAGQIRSMRTYKRDRERHRQALDTFSRRAKVRCGPLSGPAPSKV